MEEKTIIQVNGYGYISIGDFCQMEKIETQYTGIVRLLVQIESGDYIRIPLRHYDGDYTTYNIYKIDKMGKK